MPLLSLTLLITLPLSRSPCFSHQVPISMFSSHLMLLWMCMWMCFVLCSIVCVCVAGGLWDLLSLSRPSGKDMNVKVSTESWVTCLWLHHCRRPLSRQPLTSIHFPEWGGVLWASLPSILSVDLFSLVQTLYLFSGQLYLPSTAFPGS